MPLHSGERLDAQAPYLIFLDGGERETTVFGFGFVFCVVWLGKDVCCLKVFCLARLPSF